eukprot:4450013-Amphidinium_carterae.3
MGETYVSMALKRHQLTGQGREMRSSQYRGHYPNLWEALFDPDAPVYLFFGPGRTSWVANGGDLHFNSFPSSDVEQMITIGLY